MRILTHSLLAFAQPIFAAQSVAGNPPTEHQCERICREAISSIGFCEQSYGPNQPVEMTISFFTTSNGTHVYLGAFRNQTARDVLRAAAEKADARHALTAKVELERQRANLQCTGQQEIEISSEPEHSDFLRTN